MLYRIGDLFFLLFVNNDHTRGLKRDISQKMAESDPDKLDETLMGHSDQVKKFVDDEMEFNSLPEYVCSAFSPNDRKAVLGYYQQYMDDFDKQSQLDLIKTFHNYPYKPVLGKFFKGIIRHVIQKMVGNVPEEMKNEKVNKDFIDMVLNLDLMKNAR